MVDIYQRRSERRRREDERRDDIHLRRSVSVSQRAPPSSSHLHCAFLIYLHSRKKKQNEEGWKEDNKEKKRKEKRIFQNNMNPNIIKEKKYPYYRILNQQLTKRPHVGIHFFFFFFYLGFNSSLCIHWPSLLIIIISMSSNMVSGKKRWGAVGWWRWMKWMLEQYLRGEKIIPIVHIWPDICGSVSSLYIHS